MAQPLSDRVITNSSGKRINLLRVAKIQRTLLLMILAMLACYAGFILVAQVVPPPATSFVVGAMAIGYIIVVVVAIVSTVRLAITLGSNAILATIVGIAMIIPMMGFILLAVTNARATRVLKQYGVRVGFMGVSADEMHKLRLGGCPNCGYDIRGLPMGTCPECGAAIAPPTSPGV